MTTTTAIPQKPETDIYLDQSAWLDHHTAIFGDGREWPEGSVIGVCHMPKEGGPMAYTHVPADDSDAAWAIIEREASLGRQTYISCAVLRKPESGRGGAKDSLFLPSVYVDIDITGGEHAAGNLPTRQQADLLVQRLPFEPTLVIHTGGGLHVWGALDEPLDLSDEAQAAIPQRLAAWLTAYGETNKFHIDAGVSSDLARVLRPAGSVNVKRGVAPVTIETYSPMASTSFAELDADLPELGAKSRHVLLPSASSAGGERVGTRLRRELLISQLLPLLGLSISGHPGRDGRTQWSAPYNAAPTVGSSLIYDGGEEYFTVHSEKLAALWKLGENRNLSSWTLLGNVLCGGDFKAAAALTRAFPDADGCWDDLADAVEKFVVVGKDGTVDGTVLVEEAQQAITVATAVVPGQAAKSFTEHLETNTPGAFVITSTLFARLCPGDSEEHGTWEVVHSVDKDGDESKDLRRVADYILWRPVRTGTLVPDTRGNPRPVEDDPLKGARFSAEAILADGRRITTGSMDAEKSVRPDLVLTALNAGLALPYSTKDKHSLETSLRVLGHGEQTQAVTYASAGWVKPDGADEWVYLAPAGSITAEGRTDRYQVGPPAGSTADALSEAQRQFGFSAVPETYDDVVKSAESIWEFIQIAPSRPEIGIALLGNLFAAPLHLPRRTTIVLVAEPGVGKSILADACQAFTHGTSVGSSDFAISIPNSSPFATTSTQAWYRDSVVFADDYRLDPSSARINEKSTEVFAKMVQGSYGSAGAMKGTQTGGLRGAPDVISSGVITAETTPDQTALITRAVIIELAKTDVPLERPAPLDVFVQGYAENGLARQMMADYIRWLAVKLNSLPGGISDLRTEAKRRQSELLAGYAAGREAETVSVLEVGWAYAREWATERGIADKLPTAEDIHDSMAALLSANARQHTLRSPGAAIMRSLVEMISSGQGHLLSAGGGIPSSPLALGWRKGLSHSDYAAGFEPINRSLPLGYEIPGGQVLITRAGIKAVAKTANLSAMKTEQLDQALAPYVVPGTRVGDRLPTSAGVAGRPRGARFSREIFIPADDAQ